MSNSEKHKVKRLKRSRSPNRSGNMNRAYGERRRASQAAREKQPSFEEIAKKIGLK